jgi:Rrf2 family protein
MLTLSRKADYALVALARLALAARQAQRPISARQIAREYGLPQAMLMNLLKQLHRAGLVRSTRGAGGGYVLNAGAEQITISRVVEAVDEPVEVAMCCTDEEGELCTVCRVARRCPIAGSIHQLNALLNGLLQVVTLEDLMRGSVHEAVRSAALPEPIPSELVAK